MMRILSVGVCGWLLVASAVAAEFQVVKEDDGVTVNLDGKLFTKYQLKIGHKPILWPIIGPNGKEVTRAYPMREGDPTEKKDHIHQKSLWFTHGSVNKVDFWAETDKSGRIVHRDFTQVAGGPQAVIATRNDWNGPDGVKVLEDERKLTFGVTDSSRYIDFDIVLKATPAAVTFGDTKEGSFGVRMSGTATVDTKMGGKIVNSDGLTDAAAWGKPAPWVDYYGPVSGDVIGIAILNHPSSFRHPTTWHVRTYGLFAANPFGTKDFTGDKTKDGSYTLESGQTMTLRYRVLIHPGDEKAGKVAEAYADYAKTK